MNMRIADQGGGLYFDVNTDKPEGLVDAINSILNVKENIKQIEESQTEERVDPGFYMVLVSLFADSTLIEYHSFLFTVCF